MTKRDKNAESTLCPLCRSTNEQCPRCQAYERLPKWRVLQAFITFVMGVPHVGQTPIFKHNKLSRVLTIFIGLYSSVILTSSMIVAFANAGVLAKALLVPAIVASVLITSGIARSMSTYVLHYASHDAFGNLSRRIGELASLAVFALSFFEYQHGHIKKHHPLLTSKEDPDQQTIAALKFVPGMTLNYYTKRLLTVMFSPRHFLLYLRGRAASQFASELSGRRRVAVVMVQGFPLLVALAGCFVFGSVMPLLAWTIAYVAPLTYGSYVSMLLFSLGLHRWFMEKRLGMTAREFYLSKTGGRFFGDDLPHANMPALRRHLALGNWWLRFLVLHLLIGKLFVLGISDNQQHDAHHIDPRGAKHQWFDSVYSRNRLATSSHDAANLWHTWGSVFTAILLNFQRMSGMPLPDDETLRDAQAGDFLRNDL